MIFIVMAYNYNFPIAMSRLIDFEPQANNLELKKPQKYSINSSILSHLSMDCGYTEEISKSISFKPSPNKTEINIEFQNKIDENIQVGGLLKVNCVNMQWESQLFFLNSNNGLVLIKEQQKRKNISQILNKINEYISCKPFHFGVDLMTGSIRIYRTLNLQTFKYAKDFLKEIRSFTVQIHQTVKEFYPEILLHANIFPYQRLQALNSNPNRIAYEKNQIQKLTQEVSISHVDLNLQKFMTRNSCSENVGSKLQKELIDSMVAKIRGNSVDFLFKDQQIYHGKTRYESNSQTPDHQYSLGTFKNFLVYSTPRVSVEGESKFIWKDIKIRRQRPIQIKDTPFEGNLTKIQAINITFEYTEQDAEENGSMEIRREGRGLQNPVLTKILAIKVPKDKQNQPTYERSMQKIQHQKKIVESFKDKCSGYTLKYYNSNEKDLKYKDFLVMDFLPNSPTLGALLEVQRSTITLSSKLMILAHVANAIRFISECGVVHLDLSLNNILVVKDYLIKLIDFGEASKVNQNPTHLPGHTLPFCSPQIFNSKQKIFNEKQDTFALGMIIFRTVFNCYPFFLSETLLHSYKNKNYCEKMLICPENLAATGSQKIMELLLRVVLKCMSPDVNERPSLDWMVIILKLMYFLVKC